MSAHQLIEACCAVAKSWACSGRPVVLAVSVALLSHASGAEVTIRTKDLLTVRHGVYASLYFSAEPTHTPNNDLPIQYQFGESGATPPGMIFEVYPCNKPETKACPQLAASNGVYLDGTPKEPGSYTFIITVTSVDGTKTSKRFTVTVETHSVPK